MVSALQVTPTALPGVLVLEPRVAGDARGFFLESWNAAAFREATGTETAFVQDNHSRSVRHVLRGIHYQVVRPQGKLVRVVNGSVFDVAVDLRRASPAFGRWVGVELSADNRKQLWVPPGFGHAFLVLSEFADFLYKTTDYWSPGHDRALRWDDPTVAVDWPLAGAAPVLSEKDARAPLLPDAEVYA
jgi:dTDP-4-dehydrorhamnose 3,5-epimerase